MRVPNIKKFNFEDNDKRLHEVRDIGKVSKVIAPVIIFNDLDEKKKKAFVDGIKRMIRSSDEYRDFVAMLKSDLDMNECTFFPQINTKKRNIRIEIHHEPFTLTDLVHIAITHFTRNGYELNDFAIAEFILQWHYMGLIGLIPLSKTVHELCHAGKIFIPLFYPFGDIAKFYSMYNKDMSDTIKSHFAEIKEQTLKFENKPPEILRKRYVYIKTDGFDLPEAF